MKKAFLFPGQGSQKLKMGYDLYSNFKEAKDIFDETDSILSKKLSSIIFGDDTELLNKTENTQPAIFTVSIALLNIIKKETGKDIKELCNFVAGHSLGEFATLTSAKAFTVETAVKLLNIRANAMAEAGQKNPGSMMAIIGLDINQVKDICEKSSSDSIFCSVANDNCPGQIVISGHNDAIAKAKILAEELNAKRCLILPVSIAAHSLLMSDAKDIMDKALQTIEIKEPEVPFISNNTATIETNPENIKTQLGKQMISGVRFRESIDFMTEQGVTDFIEIGSGNILTGLVKRCSSNATCTNINNLETFKDFLNNLQRS